MRAAYVAAATLGVALVVIVGSQLATGDKAPATFDSGVYLTGPQAATAICQGVDRIPQTALAGSCGGRLNICGAFNAAATITANPLYICPTPGTPIPAPTDTVTPAPGTPTATPHVILGGRDD